MWRHTCYCQFHLALIRSHSIRIIEIRCDGFVNIFNGEWKLNCKNKWTALLCHRQFSLDAWKKLCTYQILRKKKKTTTNFTKKANQTFPSLCSGMCVTSACIAVQIAFELLSIPQRNWIQHAEHNTIKNLESL